MVLLVQATHEDDEGLVTPPRYHPACDSRRPLFIGCDGPDPLGSTEH